MDWLQSFSILRPPATHFLLLRRIDTGGIHYLTLMKHVYFRYPHLFIIKQNHTLFNMACGLANCEFLSGSGLQLQIGDAFLRAWLEPLPSLRFVQGLKAHADPPGVAPIFRCNPYGWSRSSYSAVFTCSVTHRFPLKYF